MKRLTFVAGINAYTGYGMHAIQIARDVERLAGAYVGVRAVSRSEAFGAVIPDDIKCRFVNGVQPEDWELLLHPPNFVPTPGKRTVYFTMHETTKLPPMGLQMLNKADVVVVPCHFNADTFSACGVTPPIRVVPLGIKPEIFRWHPFGSGDIIFGAAGRMAHGGVRKGLRDVIAAFKKAFPRRTIGVRLNIKCYPDCGIEPEDDPRIHITAAHLSERQLAEWFSALTAFVSVARGEGWGLMQQQAMAIGRPLISPRWAGVAEFFDHRFGVVLPHKLEPAQAAYEGQGHWAETSMDDLVSAMRWVRANHGAMPEIGAAAAAHAGQFTWERSNQQLVNVLREFGAL